MGVLSKNLFDKDHAVVVAVYPHRDTGVVIDSSESTSRSLLVKVSPNTSYVFSVKKPDGDQSTNRMRISGYQSHPQIGMGCTFNGTTDATVTTDGDYRCCTFTTTVDTRYILIFLWSRDYYFDEDIPGTIQNYEFQLEYGSVRTAYEPFGYQIASMPAESTSSRPGTAVWDRPGERWYETGVDRTVLYPIDRGRYTTGVPWNGVTAINENASGAEATPVYADNVKYLNLLSEEDFKATIEAYSYPDEFKPCLGETELARGVTLGQQKRKSFGLCYRTLVGNDVNGTDLDYKLHLVFECLAAPSDRSHTTVNDSPEAMTQSWEISTTPVEVENHHPTASMVLSSAKMRKAGLYNVLKRIEDILYGTSRTSPTFLRGRDIVDTLDQEMYLRDTDNDPLLDSAGNRMQSRVFS